MNLSEIENQFQSARLKKLWERFKPTVRNSIAISPTRTPESKIKPGQSKIGGIPDMPAHIEWPTCDSIPLSFIAQINFAETHLFDIQGELPTTGIACFFYAKYGPWGNSTSDKGSFRVLYHDVPVEQLSPKANPDSEHVFLPCTLKFQSVLNVPDDDHSFVERLLHTEYGGNMKRLNDDFAIFVDKLGPTPGFNEYNKLLGHSTNIQGGMELSCAIIDNSDPLSAATSTYGDRVVTMDKALQEQHRWKLLFQIDSVQEAGMMWGDSGCLYYWIKEDDLASKNFNDVWMILQCF